MTTTGRPPEGCTCIWATYFLNDGGHRSSIHIAAQECPARPHDRVYVTDPPAAHHGRSLPDSGRTVTPPKSDENGRSGYATGGVVDADRLPKWGESDMSADHCECFTCPSCPHPEPHYCNACSPVGNGRTSEATR